MRAFLFDAQPVGNNIYLWLKTANGMVRVAEEYKTFFYAKHEDMAGLETKLKGKGLEPVLEEMPNLYGGVEQVFRISVGAADFNQTVRWLEKEYKYKIDLYNCDIQLNHRYLYDKGLMPLHEVEFEYEGNGSVSAAEVAKLKWIENVDKGGFEYEVPKLKTLSLEFKLTDKKYGENTHVTGIYFNGELFRGYEKKLLWDFKYFYEKEDPDVVIFDNEEEFLIPFLCERMKKYGWNFNFGREKQEFELKRGKSYFSYGHIVRRAPAYYFHGRWHLNANWFMFSEGNLNGLMEFSRTTGVLPQKAARTSPGSGVSNLQVLEAYRQGYLVPYKKNQTELFKSGMELYAADRGGMILEPKVGLHTDIAEIDFFSLYPSIMVVHNLSPETMECTCCKEERNLALGEGLNVGQAQEGNCVPQLGFRVCTKRDGILRTILAPILKRRKYYKKMKKETTGEIQQMYEERSAVLKWLLVTCFGYTGYKNAKFGRIECHQSICAYARHKLLQAMRIAEKHGFQVVHGIIDSMWIKKEGYRKEEVEAVCREIEEVTKVPIKIENFYRWFVFLPSLVNAKVPVPSRFYGANLDGEIKVRGIELRRRDTCDFIKRFQEECLLLLAAARDAGEFHERIPQLFFVLDKYLKKLRDGDVMLHEVIIKRQLSKPLNRYRGNNVQKHLAEQLTKRNVVVAPGMSVRYVYVKNGTRGQKQYQKAVPTFLLKKEDVIAIEEYEKLLIKALEAVLLPFGFDEEAIQKKLEREKQMVLNDYQISG